MFWSPFQLALETLDAKVPGNPTDLTHGITECVSAEASKAREHETDINGMGFVIFG